jgi:hypothetical protein
VVVVALAGRGVAGWTLGTWGRWGTVVERIGMAVVGMSAAVVVVV